MKSVSPFTSIPLVILKGRPELAMTPPAAEEAELRALYEAAW